MKNLLIIIQILMIVIFVVGCKTDQDLKDVGLSSDEYPVETAYINKTYDYSIVVDVESWEFISENMILIESVDGETFIVDKERVTFNSSKEYNQQ